MKKALTLFTAGLLAIGLIGCEDEERKNVFKAQQCLNTIDVTNTAALDSNVTSCLGPIANATSEEALILRCSGEFIKGQITETAIVNAIKEMEDNPTPGSNPSTTLVTYMGFTPANTTNSQNTVTICTQSGSETLSALANLANVSTHFKFLMEASPQGNIDDWVDTCTTGDTCMDGVSTEDLASMADSVVAMQDTLCGENGMFDQNDNTCVDINSAINNAPKDGNGNIIDKDAFIESLLDNFES